MFGEDLPEPVYDAAFEAAEQCNVMILIGTSALVYPAAELPEIAMRNKFAAKLIVIDPEPPLVSEAAHVVLKGRAEQVLPDLLGMFLDKQPKIKR
jgi:NAD-dependent deacetylase